MSESNLPLIGRDYVLIEKLAREIYKDIRRGEITPLHERADKRGFDFRVKVYGSDGKPTGHIARVEITLDGVDPHPESEQDR
jgi:hypothetical protein